MAAGLLGGTFDPIHFGHLDVARAARLALGLDRVALVPSRVPSHRHAPHASAAHRFAMVALAIQHDPGLVLSDAEMEGSEPAYTVDTLDRLMEQGADTRALFFVTGADAFKDIRTWKNYSSLIDRCHFVVVSRPGLAASSLAATLPELAHRMVTPPFTPRHQPSIFLVDAPTAPVSSTIVRHTIENGGEWTGMVPAEVATYISRHGLYGRTSAP
jgi:nicotinate-nucleotide adenylyltransferase